MSKELTPLQALKDLQEVKGWNNKEFHKRLTVIKKALKEHELMKQARFIVANKEISDDDIEKLINQRMFADSLEQREIKPLFDEETQKKLKAFEIIKNKNFDLFYLLDSRDLEDYNDKCDCYRNLSYLTQEEYDLLKEVLK